MQKLRLLALVACFVQSMPVGGTMPKLGPPVDTNGLSQVTLQIQLQFVPGFTHLSNESIALIKELTSMHPNVATYRRSLVLLHSDREGVDPSSFEAERDRARIRALQYQIPGQVLLRPLQSPGDARSWNDGRVRLQWLAYCKRGITEQECRELLLPLAEREIPLQ